MKLLKPSSTSLQRSSLLTIEQVAERCSVSARTVRRWIASRALPVHRLGTRNLRISEHDLAAFCLPIGRLKRRPPASGIVTSCQRLRPLREYYLLESSN